MFGSASPYNAAQKREAQALLNYCLIPDALYMLDGAEIGHKTGLKRIGYFIPPEVVSEKRGVRTVLAGFGIEIVDSQPEKMGIHLRGDDAMLLAKQGVIFKGCNVLKRLQPENYNHFRRDLIMTTLPQGYASEKYKPAQSYHVKLEATGMMQAFIYSELGIRCEDITTGDDQYGHLLAPAKDADMLQSAINQANARLHAKLYLKAENRQK